MPLTAPPPLPATPQRPPPLPVPVLDMAPVPPGSPRPSVGRFTWGARLVLCYLLCSWGGLGAVAAAVAHREVTYSSPAVWVAVQWVFCLFVAFGWTVFVLHYTLGGAAVALAYACAAPRNRTGWWVMGPGFGLLSAFLLMELLNAGFGPAIKPLAFPIPGRVAAFVVPVVGAVLGTLVAWSGRRDDEAA